MKFVCMPSCHMVAPVHLQICFIVHTCANLDVAMACVCARARHLCSPLFSRPLAPASIVSRPYGKYLRNAHSYFSVCVAAALLFLFAGIAVETLNWRRTFVRREIHRSYCKLYAQTAEAIVNLTVLWSCRSCVAQAQPSKKGPEKTVKIYCAKCQEQLYKYKKVGVY